jgi:hypothetical protein
MFCDIINPALCHKELVFQSPVTHPETQEIIIPKGARLTYAHITQCLQLGIDMLDVDDDLG